MASSKNIDSSDEVIKIMLSDRVVTAEVSNLLSLNISDDTPNIQSYSKSIELYLSSPLNPSAFIDFKAFETPFDKDFELIGKIEALILTGEGLIAFLYAYRSMSKALPEINIEIAEELSAEEKGELIGKRNEINRKVLDIMKPTIIKIKELINFVSESTNQFRQCIIHLINLQQTNASVPSDLYSALISLLDVMIKIDSLKDIKPSIQNDFSRYKRALGGQFTGELMEELSRLQNFLTSPQDPRFAKNYIFLTLRVEIKGISSHDDILLDMLAFSYSKFESSLYITSEEKFQLLRVIPYLVLLLDGNGSDPKSVNVFRTHKAKLATAQKLCKKYPILPLFGDITITTFYVIQRADHFDFNSMANQWASTSEDVSDAGYNIGSVWEALKKAHVDFSHRLSLILLKVKSNMFSKALDQNLQLSKEVFSISKEGLSIISSYNTIIQLYFSWKYSHPASEEALIEQDVSDEIKNSPGIEYSKAIKYNISAEDLTMLIELIAMLKSLSTILSEAESHFAPIIRMYIHNSIQQLVQVDLMYLLNRADKKNKKALLTELLQIRALAADWQFGVEPKDDYKTYQTGKTTKKLPSRVVGLSATQHKILRSLVYSLNDDRAANRRKEGIFFGRSEMRNEDIEIFDKFFNESYFFPSLLNLSGSIREASDLGYLWYREFYLELARCVQFPIEMSIPWMMAEHLVLTQATDEAPIIENIFYVLDIYNDAAHQSLHRLQQQHLYDEIEAETNLVFDQLVFLMAEELYNYYKNLASSNYLDRHYRYKLEELKQHSSSSRGTPVSTSNLSNYHLTVFRKRYEIPASQKCVSLLGRSINFHFLLGQHINNKFYRDIDVAIRRFEACDFTGIVELVTIIAILQNCHDQLTSVAKFELDEFSSILNETNESFSPATFKGRISVQILRSLIMDIYPNFSYNYYTRRFIRSPIILRPIDYAKPPKQSAISQLFGTQCYKAFEHWFRLTRSFVGRIHMEHLMALLIYADLFMIIDESINNLSDKLQTLSSYIGALHGGIPPITHPKYNFLSVGSYGYFEGKLKSILDYDDLKPEVYQGFREIGNTIAFLRDLSDVLEVRSGFEFINLSPFVGIAPDTTTSTASKPLSTPIGMILGSLKGLSPENICDTAYSSGIINQIPQLAEGLVSSITTSLTERKSLFKGVLKKLEEVFYKLSLFDSWAADGQSSRVSTTALDLQTSQAFHKLWSALIFLYCLSQRQSSAGNSEETVVSDEEEFGHGFALAGCLFVHILDQRSAFELFDFSGHVLKVYEAELLGKQGPSVEIASSLVADTEDFIDAAVTLKKLQDEIFAFLNAQLPRKQKPSITTFHPSDDN